MLKKQPKQKKPAERVERTCKVAIPHPLHAATKAVASRRSWHGDKTTVQDLVADCLRGDSEIHAEETRLMKGALA